jgi:hypothetical protein
VDAWKALTTLRQTFGIRLNDGGDDVRDRPPKGFADQVRRIRLEHLLIGAIGAWRLARPPSEGGPAVFDGAPGPAGPGDQLPVMLGPMAPTEAICTEFAATRTGLSA